MKRLLIEALFILFLSLFLALTYNGLSSSGLRILPRKENKTVNSLKQIVSPPPAIRYQGRG
jgi:hypothetical protein